MNINLRQHTTEALYNLAASRLRTVLAILGILVGTASVVALVSSGLLATSAALKEFQALGTDLLAVSIYEQSSNNNEKVDPFTIHEALGLESASSNIRISAPYTTLYTSIVVQGEQIYGSTIGATEDLKDVINISMANGRFINYLDGYAYYAVIGHDIAEQMNYSGIDDPVGKQIRLGETIFTIIGVAKPWPENNFFYEDINSAVIVPIQTGSILSNYARIRDIAMRLQDETNIDNSIAAVTDYINTHAPDMQTFFRSSRQVIESMESQQTIYTLLLGLIGSISLLVGGIGVMNIMLVSVVERRREIGIRKAIGAKRRDIQMLFLTESVALSLLGGTFGVIVGVLTSYFIALFADWDFVFFMLPPLIGFVVSVAIGIFFGFYPAYQAAKLDPIETLRTE